MSNEELIITFNKTINSNFFVKGDAEHLYRVFLNLIKNSIEAIDEKKQKIAILKEKLLWK